VRNFPPPSASCSKPSAGWVLPGSGLREPGSSSQLGEEQSLPNAPEFLGDAEIAEILRASK